MTTSGRVLIIDDHEAMRDVVVDTLASRGFGAEAMPPDPWRLEARLATDDIDVVLTDLRMPGFDGLEVVRRCGAARPDVPVVVMTAFGSLEAAVDAMRAGAWDFVQKPIDGPSLKAVLDRALKHRRLTAELRRLQAAAPAADNEDMVAGTEAMRNVLAVIQQVAPLDVTVLVTGESGTGKELVARALHARSARSNRAFVAVNCAALPEALLESQLFGHVRGAFTDAHTDRSGLFAEARGGTILLDEFGELPLTLQPKLLRALQERTFRPVGGARDIPFDARIVVATNRPLEQMVQSGRFREDLSYRVNVVSLELPPLRARTDDILPLAHTFLKQAARRMSRDVRHIDPVAAELLLGWEWPGNVRELANAIERAVALTRFDTIVATDLPERLRQHRPVATTMSVTTHATELLPLDEVERRHILAVLAAVGGNRGRAAAVLGIDPKTLYRKLRARGPESRGPAADVIRSDRDL